MASLTGSCKKLNLIYMHINSQPLLPYCVLSNRLKIPRTSIYFITNYICISYNRSSLLIYLRIWKIVGNRPIYSLQNVPWSPSRAGMWGGGYLSHSSLCGLEVCNIIRIRFSCVF